LGAQQSSAVSTLHVSGTPAPKGSARAMLIGGRARLIASSSGRNETAQSRWSKAVREAALDQPEAYAATPLQVRIVFRVERPRGHYGSGRNAGKLKPSAPARPATKPDLDKLVRCTLDALVTTTRRGRVHHGIIDDDSRIVEITASKVYAQRAEDAGAVIEIDEDDAR
jgi:crossover junction endodeoxyribonuclease RusA